MGYSKTGVISYKKKPEKGEPGPKGPFVYPAGIYVQGSDTKYTATALTAPMVVFENQMYILNVVGTVGSELNPKDDYAANGSKATWVLMPQYKAAYYEIFFAEFAKLGSAIFSGDYMLSQHGVDENGQPSTRYDLFGEQTVDGKDKFAPNISIDWLTGKMKGKDVEIEGSIKAKNGWFGKISQNADGKLSGNGMVITEGGIKSTDFSAVNGIGTYYSTNGMSVYAKENGVLVPHTGQIMAAKIHAVGDASGVTGLQILAKYTGYAGNIVPVTALTLDVESTSTNIYSENIALDVLHGKARFNGDVEIKGRKLLITSETEIRNDVTILGHTRIWSNVVGTTKKINANDYPAGTLLIDSGQNSEGWYMLRIKL